jgi:hypothetical protein
VIVALSVLAVLVVLAVISEVIWPLCHRRKGRHRGVFPKRHWLELTGGGYLLRDEIEAKGVTRHRGKYVEKPEWKRPGPPWFITPQGNLIYTGKVTFRPLAPQNGVATLTMTPSGGIASLPALIGGPVGEPPPVITTDTCQRIQAHLEAQREQEIRDVVNDELNSTPIYTGLRYAGVGGNDTDISGCSAVRPAVADEPVGG